MSFHLEHVPPQSWHEHWPLPDDVDPELEQRRRLAKHMLGNLMLRARASEVVFYGADFTRLTIRGACVSRRGGGGDRAAL
jgi:hypothetical protein